MSPGSEYWLALAAIGELGVCLVLAITGLAGYQKYREEKRKERLEEDFRMRRDLILNSQLMKIQAVIEHRSEDLGTMLRKLVDAEDPFAPGLLDRNEEELHQQLDNYLNYLEAVGSLRTRKWLQEEDYTGFWSYYFGKIGQWPLLYEYISDPRYEWYDVLCWARQLKGDM